MHSEQWIYCGMSWDVPLMLFFDRYYFRETRFSGIEVIRKAGVIENKRQNRKRKKKKEKRNELYKTIKMTYWLTQLV